MIQLIKIHKWAILFAFLVGVIVAFPQFYFSYDHADTYQGVYIATTDNEYSYLNRIQEVRDGHPSMASAVLKDGKDDPYFLPPLDEILVAYLGKIFFLNLNSTILLARFLFAFLVFLAVYGFVFLISKEKLTALAASTAVCLAKSLLGRGALVVLLKGGAPTADFLDLYRPAHPQVDFLFFFSFLLFFWLFFERKRWIWGVISTLILGLSFYTYPYTWSLLYAFLGVLFLILLFQKKWPDAKRVFFLGLGAFAIGIFYFLNVYAASLHPYFEEVILRCRYIDTRQPVFGILVPSILIIFLLFFPKNWRERFIFCLALAIAPLLVLNQQIITGKEFSSGHYHWYYNQLTAIIFLVIVLFYQIRLWQEKLGFLTKKNTAKLAAFLVIVISFYTGITIQAGSYKASEARILSDQRYGAVAEWLNANAQKDEVFLAEPYQAGILSIYTPLNTFYSNRGDMYLAGSNERILNSLFLFYRLNGVDGAEARSLFLQEEERRIISYRIYGTYYKNVAGNAAAIPDELLCSFAEKYQIFLSVPLDKILKTNDVKYVVWDTKNHPQWQLDQYQFLNKVYEEGDFKIYYTNL